MKICKQLSYFLFVVFALSAELSAAVIVNGGFELPAGDTAINGYKVYGTGANVAGWTVVGPQVLRIGTNYTEGVNGGERFNAQEGNYSLDITGAGNWGTDCGIYQDIATSIGQEYLLSFYVGRITPADGPAAQYATSSTVDLQIDAGSRMSFNTGSDLINGFIYWKPFSYTFTATQETTRITFYNGTTDNNEVGLDNVTIAAVPEPASVASWLVFGVAGLYLRRRGAKSFQANSKASC